MENISRAKNGEKWEGEERIKNALVSLRLLGAEAEHDKALQIIRN
jgi:hypothetical protein